MAAHVPSDRVPERLGARRPVGRRVVRRRLVGVSAGLIRSQAAIFAVLAAWMLFPLVGLLIYVGRHGGVLTGANGSDAFDQMQYLAWIRDAGNHLLASNLWQIGSTAHDYLHPMYLISGLLWRLGVSIQLSYLVWEPVALLVMFLGFAVYVRHLLGPGPRRQAAALFLALFYLSPALAFATWTGHLTAAHRLLLTLATDDADSALNLWGFAHAAIAIGLMPVFLIACERLLAGAGATSSRRWIAVASAAGLLVSWLHPWQGVILLAVIGILFAVAPPRRRFLALIVPALATVLPLVYGVALSHFDASWHSFQQQTIGDGTAPWWALLASFGPLGAFAAAGIRRPRDDRSWMLLLWLVSCAGVYFLVPQFPPHALSGVTLPLSVLAVGGWQRVSARLRAPRWPAATVAVAGVLLFTVPGAIYHLNASVDYRPNTIAGLFSRQLQVLTPDQSAALSYLDRAPRQGAVLAPWLLSMSIPGFTGREVFAGHPQWQPHANVTIASAFFSPTLHDPTGAFRRAILVRSKVTFVLADCGAPPALARAIAPVTRPVGRFGCVTVYETR